MQLISFLLPLQHIKRPALQNKQVVVLRLAFRAQKVVGTFEKRAPGVVVCMRARFIQILGMTLILKAYVFQNINFCFIETKFVLIELYFRVR